MSMKLKGVLSGISIILIYSLIYFILWWQDRPQPYEQPPKATKAEEKAIKAKKIGNFTLITVPKGIYIERRGQIEWLIRRGN